MYEGTNKRRMKGKKVGGKTVRKERMHIYAAECMNGYLHKCMYRCIPMNMNQCMNK